MLSVSDINNLKNIKEAPSNLSQDKVRIQFNENFRIIRSLLEQILKSNQTNIDIVQNLNIIFPTNPDVRIQYILKYNQSIGKWMVTEFLGTQHILDIGEAVKIGNKHQHIVHKNMDIAVGAEAIINAGGELVVIDGSAETIISYTILNPLQQLVLQDKYIFNGVVFNGTGNSLTITKNGSTAVNIDDIILPSDYITIGTGNLLDVNSVIHISVTKII